MEILQVSESAIGLVVRLHILNKMLWIIHIRRNAELITNRTKCRVDHESHDPMVRVRARAYDLVSGQLR
jgi:hypothetical protein